MPYIFYHQLHSSSSIISTSTFTKGSLSLYSEILPLFIPSTRTLIVSPGNFNICFTLQIVPILYISFSSGSSIFDSFVKEKFLDYLA